MELRAIPVYLRFGKNVQLQLTENFSAAHVNVQKSDLNWITCGVARGPLYVSEYDAGLGLLLHCQLLFALDTG